MNFPKNYKRIKTVTYNNKDSIEAGLRSILSFIENLSNSKLPSNITFIDNDVYLDGIFVSRIDHKELYTTFYYDVIMFEQLLTLLGTNHEEIKSITS